MPLDTSCQSQAMEAPVTGPYDLTLGTRVMLDSALISTFLDIFTLLKMLTGPSGLSTPTKLEFLGQPLPNEPITSSCRIDDEIRHRFSGLNGRLSRWEATCTRAHFLLIEHDANIHELRKKLIDDGELIKRHKWTESTQRSDIDAMKKAHDTEFEGLKKKCDNQLSRINQLEQDIKTSHVIEMTIQKGLKPLKSI